MPLPLVLIHGYSDTGSSFIHWKNLLVKKGLYRPEDIHICSYRTLTNEVTIKDVAEGFDRALRIKAGIMPDKPFDAIVHSTGMLVLRSWLCVYGRHERVKHIIGLAPATFGSPIAHKGRSWIGSIFKGNREAGPDFMEAGNLVLDGLELGSHFTWDLAHKDLLGDEVFYGATDMTPYVFTFCGNEHYSGLKGLLTYSPGTDGTVRWAGCALNTRKITLDFTMPPDGDRRYQFLPQDNRTNLSIPFIPIDGLNHATIIENPSERLIELVTSALKVNSLPQLNAWTEAAIESSKGILTDRDLWQQFIIRARDERGDPITDFNLQLYKVQNESGSNAQKWEPIKLDVHTYSTDNSYRCFHVNLHDISKDSLDRLKLEFMASSGTDLLGYYEYIPESVEFTKELQDLPTFTMDLTDLLTNEEFKFFYPYTTTMIEVILNREPLPVNGKNEIAFFI